MPAPDLETLVREHAPFLRRLARALVGDGPAADDLVQETWLAAARTRVMRSPRAWLASTARHLAAREYRGRQQRAATLETEPPAAGPDTAAVAAALEAERALLAALDATEEPFRTALYLRYREELGPPAIAERLDVPLATVRSRLRRGLARLRERLDRDTGGQGRAVVLPLALGLRRTVTPTALASSAALLSMKNLLPVVALLVLAVGLAAHRAQSNGRSDSLGSARAQPLDALGGADAGRPTAASPDRRSSVRTAVGSPLVSVDDAHWTLDVQVVQGAQEPVPGRVVQVLAVDKAGLFPGREAVTNAQGLARFDRLPFGRFEIETGRGASHPTAERYEPGLSTVSIVEGLEWVSGAGRVLTGDGRPVAGAAVRAVGTGPVGPLVAPLTLTGPDGTFELSGHQQSDFFVTAEGYLPSPTFEGAALVDGVEIRLEPAAHGLSGRVLAPVRGPVEGARVVVRSHAPRPELDYEYTTHLVARTDADGRFSLGKQLPDERLEITVVAEGFAVLERVLRAPGPWADPTFELRRGRAIDVSVVDASGAPVVDAVVFGGAGEHRVFEGTTRGVWSPVARTDADGRATLRDAPYGIATVVAERGDPSDALERGYTHVPPSEGVSVAAEVRITDRPRLSGHVVGTDGLPRPGLIVDAEGVTARHAPHVRSRVSVRTDADGRFVLTSLHAAEHVDPSEMLWRAVVHDPEDWRVVLGRSESVAPDVETVVVVVQDAGSATGGFIGKLRLRDDGVLPSDLVVTWIPEDGFGRRVPLTSTGDFRVDGLAPGRYSLSARAGQELRFDRRGIDVRRDEIIDLGTLTIGATGRVEFLPAFDFDIEVPPEALANLLEGQHLQAVREDGARAALAFENRAWSAPFGLQPGRWGLEHRLGEKMVIDAAPFDVRDGETTECVARVRLAHPVWVEVLGLDPDPRGTLEVTVEEVGGERPWRESSGALSVTALGDRPIGLKGPCGRECVVRAVTSTGLEASERVGVPQLTEGLGRVRLQLR